MTVELAAGATGFIAGAACATALHFASTRFVKQIAGCCSANAKKANRYKKIGVFQETCELLVPTTIGGIAITLLKTSPFNIGLKIGMTLASGCLTAVNASHISHVGLADDAKLIGESSISQEAYRHFAQAADFFKTKGVLAGGAIGALLTPLMFTRYPSFFPYICVNYVAHMCARPNPNEPVVDKEN